MNFQCLETPDAKCMDFHSGSCFAYAMQIVQDGGPSNCLFNTNEVCENYFGHNKNDI